MKSNKHKISQKTALTSGKVNNFFTPLKANYESLKLAAKEITLAFHTVMHNHSFNSMTCTADLIRLLFNEKKFTVYFAVWKINLLKLYTNVNK